jgi:eukaryotic-like serine/threonine-protein kinase
MTDDFRDALQSSLGSAFTLERELGGGGMSRVFLARDQQLGRQVVVKVLSPELVAELSVERFGREIMLAAALQHPNIVPVLSASVTPRGLPYYLMPFVDGASLREKIAEPGALSINTCVQVLADVSRALGYAHDRGVVHRDIKPDNVMLSGGAAMVTDFGIAKAMSSSRDAAPNATLTRMGTSLGTPIYMAPEQGAGDPTTDHRADLYAFGAMAYEMLTGAPPFADRPAHALLVAHLTELPVDVRTRRPETPEPLAQLVMSCLAKDPDHRPQSAAAASELLADAASAVRTGNGAAVPAVARTPGSVAQSTPRGRRWAPFAIGAGLLVVATGSWVAMRARSASIGPDRTLLAVMPFTVRDPALNIWREGLADVLSRSLDGAGALHTVPASTSIGRAPDRADLATATAHGKALGAGLVVFGDLSALGSDSVRARVAVVDVNSGSIRQEIDLRNAASRMDALTDSLSLRVLAELGSSGDVGGSARLSSLGTNQLPALKAYLRGLQLVRRGSTDSSLVAFQESVAADSTFSLGWRGVASIYIRTGREASPEAQDALDRAIRFKRGRSPRDSMLLRGDSLRLALVRLSTVPNEPIADIPILPALLQTLNDATARYPTDAELWLELGDAGFHFGALAGVPDSVVLAQFMRAIALDSNVIVPQFHAATLAMRTGNTAIAAARYRAIGRLLQDPRARTFYGASAAILDSAPRVNARARSVLDTLPLTYVAAIVRDLAGHTASLSVARTVAAAARTRLGAPVNDTTGMLAAAAFADAMAGAVDSSAVRHLSASERHQLAMIGGWSVPAVAAEARAALRANQPLGVLGSAAALAAERDTVVLTQLARTLDSLGASVRGSAGADGQLLASLVTAWATLARGDSARALTQFAALPTSICRGSPCAGLTLARLLTAAGRDREAARVLDRWMPTGATTIAAPNAMLLRGELAAKLGDNSRAKYWLSSLITRWEGGGAAVQPSVRAARDRLRQIGGG